MTHARVRIPQTQICLRLCLAILSVLAMGGPTHAQERSACAADPAHPATSLETFVNPGAALPLPDSFDVALGCVEKTKPIELPESPWVQNERHLARIALGKYAAETLVLPIQVQGFGLDPIERSIMASDLARALGARHSIADPFLVDRALGMSRRRFTPADIDDVARSTGAAHIVATFAGQDLHHNLILSIHAYDRTGSATQPAAAIWQKDWRSIPFSDDEPPALLFHKMLPEVSAALDSRLGPRLGGPRDKERNGTEVPATLVADALPKKFSAAEKLTLLGSLAGSHDGGSGARLYVRALIAALVEKPSAHTSWLQAYILMSLDRRPAGLARLGDNPAASFATLRALANGNLTGAEALLPKVSDPFEQFLLAIATRDLEYIYLPGRSPVTVAEVSPAIFGAQYMQWAPLVGARLLDRDPWKMPAALLVKTALDEAFPQHDLSAEAFVQGSHVISDSPPDEIDMDLVSAKHLARIEGELLPPDCCSSSLHPDPRAMLLLMQSLFENRIAKSAYLQSRLQNRPADTLRDLERYEPTLEGHPVLALARAQAAALRQGAFTGAEKASWIARMGHAAELAAYLEQGQTVLASQAATFMILGGGLGTALMQAYTDDYPQHADWRAASKVSLPNEERRRLDLEALAYSQHDLWPLIDLARADPAGQSALYSEIGDRFSGSIEMQNLLASHDVPSARPPPDRAPITPNQAATPQGEDFPSYVRAADAQLRANGQYEAAGKTLLSFPGFYEEKPGDRVAESNNAETAGSFLYWLGQPELARPLYQIGVNLHTGSEAEFISALHLRVMNGDLPGALLTAHDWVQNYPDAYGFSVYLSFLHTFGFGKQAWQGFNQVATKFDEPGVWSSAFVGLRHEGASDAALEKWLSEPSIRDAHFEGMRFAPYFAVLWYTTDRTPPAGAAALINKLEWPNGTRISADGYHVERPRLEDPESMQTVDWSALNVKPPIHLPPGTPVPSQYAMFMEGYIKLRHEQFPAALDDFLALAARYPIETTGTGPPTFALPYVAYAAARSGDPTSVERFVDQLKWGPLFDRWLAKAFFAAAHKDVDAAARDLQSAFYEKDVAASGSNASRPVIVDYEYAQACLWVYDTTGDARFSTMALDWARKAERILPNAGWPYAIEFQYATDPDARIKALAMTMYLDPLSDRIKTASAPDRDAAKTWLRTNNPFSKKQASPDNSL